MNKIDFLQKFEYLAYCLLMVSFFLPIKYNSIAVIFLGLAIASNFIVKNNFFNALNGPKTFLSLFMLLAIGLVYSENLLEGWNVLGRHASLVFMPFLVAGSARFSKKQRLILMDIFLISAAILGIICLSIAYSKYLETGSVYIPGKSVFFGYNNFMHQRLTEPVEMHAIYFSFYLSFGGLLILNYLISNWKNSKFRKVTYPLLFIFFLVLLYLLKSSLFSFAFALACALLIFIKMRHYFTRNIKRFSILAILLISIGALSYIGIKSKLETFRLDYKLSDDHLTPLTMRFAMWECSINLINEKPFLGYGTGDAKKALLNEYERSGFKIGLNEKFNSHNMYLHYAIMIGIVGTILFLLLLLNLIYKSIQTSDLLFFLFILLFSLFSITESTMMTQRGVVFFVFFAALFYQTPNFWNFNPSVKR